VRLLATTLGGRRSRGRMGCGGALLRPVADDGRVGRTKIPPPETSALAARLGRSSRQLLTVLRTALPIAGAIAAAPILAAGAVVTGLAAGLDPIVFGVIPAGDPVAREPAAWYMLAQWTWPDVPGQSGNS
jgi:hypothetical protein